MGEDVMSRQGREEAIAGEANPRLVEAIDREIEILHKEVEHLSLQLGMPMEQHPTR